MGRTTWRAAVAIGGVIASALIPCLGVSPLVAQQDPSPQSQAGSVSGRVITPNGVEYEPVANALVTAADAERSWRVETDRQGRFEFTDLTDGTYTLRVLGIGYTPTELDVVLAGGRAVTVEIVLSVRPVVLRGVDVRGDARETAVDTPTDPSLSGLSGPESRAVDLGALEAGSGMAASGLTRLFSGVPGNDPGDPSDVLFMRGSSMDTKLVLLDGAPLYTPFHVSGLLPAFDPGLLTSAKLHNGASPPEFDGGLAHVLDLRTRSSLYGEPATYGSADLLSARMGARLPVGERAGLSVGARGLHAAAEELMGGGFPYGYRDVVARADVAVAGQHRLEATAFANVESVALDFGALPSSLGTRASVPTFPSQAEWGNRALSVGYVGAGDKTTVSLRGALSAYDAELPIRSTLPLFADGRTERSRVAGVVRRSVQGGFLRFGVTRDVIDLAYNARRLATDSVPGVAAISSRGSGSVVAGFADGSVQVAPTVRVGGGLRVAQYLGEHTRVAPHASITWLFGDQAALTIRGGRSDQLSTGSDQGLAEALAVDALEDPSVSPTSALVPPSSSLLSVASASNVVVSLDQFVSERTRLGLDGWLRRYSGLGAGQPDRLNGSGVDLRIVRSGPALEGWFGYSLSWYWTPDTGTVDPFQGRQLLSAGVTGRIAGEGRASLQLSFGDGLPFTAISVEDAAVAPGLDSPPDQPQREFGSNTEQSRGNPLLAGGPSGDFLRLDGELSWSIERMWGSRRVQLRPYVRLLNALNRRDAMFYYFEAFRDAEARPLAEMSIMPILGLSWHF